MARRSPVVVDVVAVVVLRKNKPKRPDGFSKETENLFRGLFRS